MPARENTLEAFAAAVHREADGVEFDVRRCADGTLVVNHDATVEGAGSIDSLEASALPDWVPTLKDALRACGELLVNVEVKSETGGPGHDPAERCAIETARMCADGGAVPDPGRIVLSSFSLPALLAARDAAPELKLAWLWKADAALDFRQRLETASSHGFAAVHPLHLLVNALLLEEAHDAGLAVRAWTVNDPERIAELAAAGADGVITDDVPTALRALGRR